MTNQNPIGSATAVLANGAQNTTYILNDSTLIQGFSDPDNDTLRVFGLLADSGELTKLSNSQWQFVPDTDFTGTVQLDYVVLDGKGGQLQASLNLIIAAPQSAPTGSVGIAGIAQQYQTLTGYNTLADVNGLGTIHYQWLSNGQTISGASQSTYALTQADVGKAISVMASYTDGLGKLESVSSAASSSVANVNDLPTGNVVINTIKPLQGQTLSITHTLADLDGLGTVTYVWKTGNTVLGSGDRYTLRQTDVGKAISVLASYTDGFNMQESVSSKATPAVANVNDKPTGQVLIDDATPAQGQTLTASHTLADLDGLGAVRYVWKAGKTVLGTGDSYFLTAADVGKAIAVTASYTDGFRHLETMTSKATALVEPTLDPAFIISTPDLLTAENGDTAIVSVQLAAAPTRDVAVTFTSSDLTEGVISHPTLSFTAQNWAIPQTFTVTGQNDFLNDGNQPFIITALIDSSDVNYRQLVIDPLVMTNKEDFTLQSDVRIPAGTLRDAPLKIYGDAILNAAKIDKATGLFETIGSKPVNDVLHGLDGNDTLFGANLQDDLSGGIGDDRLSGENDEDHLYGEDGNDTLFGGDGVDTLEGGAGNDVLNGGDADLAADVLIGGAGDDTYYLGYGVVDKIDDKGLSSDVDTVIMPYQLSSYTLPASIEKGTIADGTGTSRLTGNDSNNELTGNEGKNTLDGTLGNDALNGGAGDDSLLGGVGNDVLQGGDGKDVLTGGTGQDRFVVDSVQKTSVDKITDFSPVDDTLTLDSQIFTQLSTRGALPAEQFVNGSTALDANDFIIYNPTTGTVTYDSEGSGAGFGVQIALLGVKLSITAADFVVV